LYQRWRKKLDVVMRQEHKAGEKALQLAARGLEVADQKVAGAEIGLRQIVSGMSCGDRFPDVEGFLLAGQRAHALAEVVVIAAPLNQANLGVGGRELELDDCFLRWMRRSGRPTQPPQRDDLLLSLLFAGTAVYCTPSPGS
jgi:hypothetical protein